MDQQAVKRTCNLKQPRKKSPRLKIFSFLTLVTESPHANSDHSELGRKRGFFALILPLEQICPQSNMLCGKCKTATARDAMAVIFCMTQ